MTSSARGADWWYCWANIVISTAKKEWCYSHPNHAFPSSSFCWQQRNAWAYGHTIHRAKLVKHIPQKPKSHKLYPEHQSEQPLAWLDPWASWPSGQSQTSPLGSKYLLVWLSCTVWFNGKILALVWDQAIILRFCKGCQTTRRYKIKAWWILARKFKYILFCPRTSHYLLYLLHSQLLWHTEDFESSWD